MDHAAEQHISIAVGQTVRLSLPGHGSGGFSWSIEESGDAGAIRIERAAGDRPALPPPGSPPPSSFSLDEVLVITGLREGVVTLDVRLRRHLEPPLEERLIIVEVVAAGKQ